MFESYTGSLLVYFSSWFKIVQQVSLDELVYSVFKLFVDLARGGGQRLFIYS